jgi:serine/threonine protein kinase
LNVLITKRAEIQLCDFGVAGTLETELDKRSTFIRTLYWMASELFDPNPNYPKEVDIWAFGCMIYKIATWLPPNLDIHVAYEHVESRSKLPMLEEDNYTHDLRSLVSYFRRGPLGP